MVCLYSGGSSGGESLEGEGLPKGGGHHRPSAEAFSEGRLPGFLPPENPEWTAGIKVNGKGNGKYDADFCLFMENWIAKKNMLQTGKLSKEKFDSWKSDMLAYYKDSRLDNEADSKTE